MKQTNLFSHFCAQKRVKNGSSLSKQIQSQRSFLFSVYKPIIIEKKIASPLKSSIFFRLKKSNFNNFFLLQVQLN